MANVPFCQTNRWLRNIEAAEALGITPRTIKRWVQCPAKRTALGVVRLGNQWRIPRPENLDYWRSDTCWRLKKLGIQLTPGWKRELRKRAKRNKPHLLEARRLWLAACLQQVAKRDGISQKARDGIFLLWQAACEILAQKPRYEMDADKFKSEFPKRFLARGLPEEQVRAVMASWPDSRFFTNVRAVHTFKDVEALRRTIDFWQACHDLKDSSGHIPPGRHISALLHQDISQHINDTRERLPGIVVRPKTPEELRRVVRACIYLTNEQRAGITIDLRQPQDGLPLRTFRNRHPLRKSPQRDIVKEVYDVRDRIPGADEGPSMDVGGIGIG
jgi:hypothetical protein